MNGPTYSPLCWLRHCVGIRGSAFLGGSLTTFEGVLAKTTAGPALRCGAAGPFAPEPSVFAAERVPLQGPSCGGSDSGNLKTRVLAQVLLHRSRPSPSAQFAPQGTRRSEVGRRAVGCCGTRKTPIRCQGHEDRDPRHGVGEGVSGLVGATGIEPVPPSMSMIPRPTQGKSLPIKTMIYGAKGDL